MVCTDKAERFGRVTLLFERSQDYPDPFTPEFKEALLRRLLECRFHPERDFIVISGRMAVLSVVTAAVADQFGGVKLLLHDVRLSDYVQVSIGDTACVH